MITGVENKVESYLPIRKSKHQNTPKKYKTSYRYRKLYSIY